MDETHPQPGPRPRPDPPTAASDLHQLGRAAEDFRPPEGDFLSYRDGREDRPRRNIFVLHLVGGFGLSVGLVVLCGFIWAVNNIEFGPPGGTRSPIRWQGPLIATLVILTPLGAGTLLARRRGNRGFVMGVLIGLAVSGLMEGICFLRL